MWNIQIYFCIFYWKYFIYNIFWSQFPSFVSSQILPSSPPFQLLTFCFSLLVLFVSFFYCFFNFFWIKFVRFSSNYYCPLMIPEVVIFQCKYLCMTLYFISSYKLNVNHITILLTINKHIIIITWKLWLIFFNLIKEVDFCDVPRERKRLINLMSSFLLC